MCFLEVPVNRGRGFAAPLSAPLGSSSAWHPRHLCIEDCSCQFCLSQMQLWERPATVLRASGKKAASGQELFPSKCSVYKCSCKALATSQQSHTLAISVLLEPGRGLSQGNLHFKMEFFKAPKDQCMHKKKKK